MSQKIHWIGQCVTPILLILSAATIGSQQVYGYKPSFNDPISISFCLASGLLVNGATIGTVN